jgi:hypothetical protein
VVKIREGWWMPVGYKQDEKGREETAVRGWNGARAVLTVQLYLYPTPSFLLYLPAYLRSSRGKKKKMFLPGHMEDTPLSPSSNSPLLVWAFHSNTSTGNTL